MTHILPLVVFLSSDTVFLSLPTVVHACQQQPCVWQEEMVITCDNNNGNSKTCDDRTAEWENHFVVTQC